MMRHSFAHLPKTMDARTAIICAKNHLFRSPLKSPLPQDVLRVVENPNHVRRLPASSGPLIVFRMGAKGRGLIQLATLFLNPDRRVRQAAVAELERQLGRHPPFLGPQTRIRFEDLRESVLSYDVQDSLGATVELHDCLRNDYFYQRAALRQCADVRADEELCGYLRGLLVPNEVAMQFLAGLPVWSPERQDADIQAMRRDMVQSAASLQDLLCEYFRLFGHLPLAGSTSAAGVVAGWREKHGDPADPWDRIWSWVKDNGSLLASYHACQVLCHVPEWVGEEHRQSLLGTIADVIRGPSSNAQWKLRCDLARHYCRHLETLSPGADSERVASFAWWFAEMLGETFDAFSSPVLRIANEIVENASRASDEVWLVARPFATVSPLRYATLFSGSMWSMAMMCEIGDSPLMAFADKHEGILGALATSLTKHECGALDRGRNDRTIWYAFQRTSDALCERIAMRVDAENADSIRSARSVVTAACTDPGLGTMVRRLASYDESVALAIAHEVRLAAYCGDAPCVDIWDSFADSCWREQVLAKGEAQSVELLCNAAIQLQLADPAHEWRSYLPHFLAMTCEDLAADRERKRLLFAYTIIASIAVDSVSAVERLLNGIHRRDYEPFVEKWRERIERLTPVAPAWIAANLRGMKASLYID